MDPSDQSALNQNKSLFRAPWSSTLNEAVDFGVFHLKCRRRPAGEDACSTMEIDCVKCSVVLLNGPSPGAEIPLDPNGAEVTIGRDFSRTVPIDDDSCSRLHARIWFDGRVWKLADCQSSNGTLVNSRSVDQTVLNPGDVIRVGDRLLVFARELRQDDDNWGRRLATSTCIKRVRNPDQLQSITSRLTNIPDSPDSSPYRAAAILCGLAEHLHGEDDRDELIRLMTEALAKGIRADSVIAWMFDINGRLVAAGGAGCHEKHAGEPPVFASLAAENNEAMLVQNGSRGSAEREMIISVPIPGRTGRRGAVEIERQSQANPFTQNDLDLAIAIVCQTGLAIENLEYREQLEQANHHLRSTIHSQSRIVGSSPGIQRVLETVARVAPVKSTVLIRGASGTGKELVARQIHDSSSVSAGPYVTVNCAAFSESLLESELFGHEKGAFTGADQRRAGQFERAHQGTMFLDEIGEMSAACQSRLLRILEGHAFERVGGSDSIHVDVRVLAATHRDLAEMVSDGKFREDLLFRLQVIEIQIPGLSQRQEDIVELAVHFLELFRRQMGRGPLRLSPSARRAMERYNWPGNVRELRNSIERAVVLGETDEVTVSDLGLPSDPLMQNEDALVSLADAELRHILRVLERVGGNKSRACKVLQIGRGTLYKKLESIIDQHDAV